MKSEDPGATSKAEGVRTRFAALVGLRLFKSWNVLATRMFYFASPSLEARDGDAEYTLILECPWRIERLGQIIVGSEDYSSPADGDGGAPRESDTRPADLQDRMLGDLLGKEENGAVLASGSNLTVESVDADPAGGFQLRLSGGYSLAAFPTTDRNMEWLLKGRGGTYLILMNGGLQGPLP